MAEANNFLSTSLIQDRERAREEQLNILTSCSDSMRRSLVLTDFSLICKGHVIPVHRLILAASSPFFHTLFTSGLKDSSSTEVYLPNLDPITMEALLDFMYNGYINIPLKNLSEIKAMLSAAYQLELTIVFNYCCSALLKTLSESHFSELWEIAQTYNHDELKTLITKFIAERFVETSSSNDFLRLPLDAVVAVINYDHLTCNTDCVLRAIIRWVKYNRPEREEEQLKVLLSYINFEDVSKKYLQEILLNESLIKNSIHLMNRLMEADSSMILKGNGLEKRSKKGKKKKQNLEKWELYPSIVKSSWPVENIEERFILMKKSDVEDGGLIRFFYPESRRAGNIESFKFPLLLESAVCYDEKKVYFIGGRNKHMLVFDLLYSFELATSKWEHVTFLDEAKFAAGSVYKNGFIYVAGGANRVGTLLNSFQRFDVLKGCWQKMPSMLARRKNPALLSGGVNLYAISNEGNDKQVTMEYYNNLNNQWTYIPLEGFITNSAEEKSFFLAWQDGFFHIISQSLAPTPSEDPRLKFKLKGNIELHTKKKGDDKYQSTAFKGKLSPILNVAATHSLQESFLLLVDVHGNILKYSPEETRWKRMACPLDYPTYAVFLGRSPSFFNIA